MVPDRRLAELALESNWVTMDDLRTIVPQARANEMPMTSALALHGLDEDRITFLTACGMALPFAQPDILRISRKALLAIPLSVQKKYRFICLRVEATLSGDTLYAAMLPESAIDLAQLISSEFGVEVIPIAASLPSITRALALHGDGESVLSQSAESAEDADFDRPAKPGHYPEERIQRQTSLLSSPNNVEQNIEVEESLITSLADF